MSLLIALAETHIRRQCVWLFASTALLLMSMAVLIRNYTIDFSIVWPAVVVALTSAISAILIALDIRDYALFLEKARDD
jgi:hypothetical protein